MDGRRRRNRSILYVDTVQCNIVGIERCKKRDGLVGPVVSRFADFFYSTFQVPGMYLSDLRHCENRLSERKFELLQSFRGITVITEFRKSSLRSGNYKQEHLRCRSPAFVSGSVYICSKGN